MQQDQFAKASAPDPNLTRLMGLNNSIIDWHTNPNTVKDIYKNPGIGSSLPVFQMMKMNLDKGRIGRGVVGRTDLNNDQYSKDEELEDDTNRSVAAGGALEMGLQNQLSGAERNLTDLTGMDINRSANLTNALGNSTNNLLGQNMNLLKLNQGNGWGGFLRGLAGGAMNLLPTLLDHI